MIIYFINEFLNCGIARYFKRVQYTNLSELKIENVKLKNGFE